MLIRIRCSVSGGVTGSRSGWLKENGQVRTFATREAADAVAAHLRATMRGPAGTRFRYEVDITYPVRRADGSTVYVTVPDDEA